VGFQEDIRRINPKREAGQASCGEYWIDLDIALDPLILIMRRGVESFP
jgi:hypothetical protein